MTHPLRPVLRSYRPADHDALVSLWSRCGLLRPWNDPRRDIERKLAHDRDGLLVLEADGCLAGSVMVGYDGHRGWVNYLAVDPAWPGRGFGRLLMDEAEQRLFALGCPKVNLQVRTPNEHVVAFYRHLGYGADDVVSMGKRLLDDAAPGQPPSSARPRRADPKAHRAPGTGRLTSLPASSEFFPTSRSSGWCSRPTVAWSWVQLHEVGQPTVRPSSSGGQSSKGWRHRTHLRRHRATIMTS